jgi:uncharacterized membrane protein
MNQWEVIITAIFAVFACSALIGWMAWRFLKSSENPRIVRRRLLRAAVIYGFGAFFGIEQVVTGAAPLWSMAFLPISLGLIWMYVRAASRIEIQPNK